MDEIQDIEQLDNDILQWDAAFLAALLVLNRNLFTEINNLIDRLALRGLSTTTEEWSANMRQVIMWQADLSSTVFRVGFGDMLNGLIIHMGNSAERLNSYYGKIIPGFDSSVYTTVIEQLSIQTRSLITSTMEATYGKVIGEVLTNAVLTKSTAAELRQVLTQTLTNEGLSTKSVATVASDSLYTFSRAYSQVVAEGLNLKHFYYMGTQIATTRSFCSARFGKAFTQKEVESWPDLTWTGKIPGTSKQTIYWYCGGYRCRHRILPISKTVYNQFVNNSN